MPEPLGLQLEEGGGDRIGDQITQWRDSPFECNLPTLLHRAGHRADAESGGTGARGRAHGAWARAGAGAGGCGRKGDEGEGAEDGGGW